MVAKSGSPASSRTYTLLPLPMLLLMLPTLPMLQAGCTRSFMMMATAKKVSTRACRGEEEKSKHDTARSHVHGTLSHMTRQERAVSCVLAVSMCDCAATIHVEVDVLVRAALALSVAVLQASLAPYTRLRMPPDNDASVASCICRTSR